MRHAKLVRSTPFRLAIAFAAMVVAGYAVAGLIVLRSIEADLAKRLDRSVSDTYLVLIGAYGEKELDDLVSSVVTHVNLSDAEDEIFLLVGENGTQLAGNIRARDFPAGWSTLSPAALGVPGDESYRVYSGSFDGNQLVVGMSFAETDEIQDIALASFAWASIVVFLLATAGSVLLAARVQRRMDALGGTMAKVSEGDLTVRVPLLGNGDDIDVASQQINSALDRLSALIEGIKQVSTDIAHDLKTPLNRLMVHIEMAIGREAKGLPAGQELSLAQIEGEQINATFDALLRIAQIESGARKARFTAINLQDIVETIHEAYEGVANDAGKSFELVGEPSTSSRILGDRDLLLQMVSNLVENSIRHCPAGSHLTLALSAADGAASISVIDNGPGIPEIEREKVLRRLYRLEKSRSTPGSGLGLSLIKAIADLHGAELTLADNGPGLKVSVTFGSIR
ncbi:signal transduction histidine kinase [Rhodoligotrophos appendicifer]|uniref:sensor histidine kinase n=1 Tax=Rhodoligotrophos appendicifer TaxID=987056 RepID=UPI001185DC0D|nr:HAMP domain-containing sensor histidine kinase [Rhodoligotrophos appendicifer]